MHDAACIVRVDFFNMPAVLFIEEIESRSRNFFSSKATLFLLFRFPLSENFGSPLPTIDGK
jgi:hypothetical protein